MAQASGAGIIGIDEVGRGSWAGPLVAGAVMLGNPITGLRDSKQLAPTSRLRLDGVIRAEAMAFGLGWVWPQEIDALGMTSSVRLAYQRALEQITGAIERIIIDGNYNYLSYDRRSQNIVKADVTVPQVSAASIIAKVARDSYMNAIAAEYPGYGFEHHVGYGTSQHRLAIATLGVSPIHRRSFAPVRASLTRNTT